MHQSQAKCKKGPRFCPGQLVPPYSHCSLSFQRTDKNTLKDGQVDLLSGGQPMSQRQAVIHLPRWATTKKDRWYGSRLRHQSASQIQRPLPGAGADFGWVQARAWSVTAGTLMGSLLYLNATQPGRLVLLKTWEGCHLSADPDLARAVLHGPSASANPAQRCCCDCRSHRSRPRSATRDRLSTTVD